MRVVRTILRIVSCGFVGTVFHTWIAMRRGRGRAAFSRREAFVDGASGSGSKKILHLQAECVTIGSQLYTLLCTMLIAHGIKDMAFWLAVK